MIAVAFPGQGAQKVGMVSSLSPQAQVCFDTASELLGYDLYTLCNLGPADTLTQTEFAQPALLVTCYSRWLDVVKSTPVQVFAGHSLGLITAMVAAKCISFSDGVRIVQKRGQLMANCGPNGSMVATLGLETSLVEQLCERAREHGWIQIANYNAPGQIVVSGEQSSLDYFGLLAKDAGAKRVIPLDVSGPFHSRLMEPAALAFKTFLGEIEFLDPAVPIVSNYESKLLTKKADIPKELVAQLTHSVQWIANVVFLESLGITELVEVSPNSILVGLTKRITKNLKLTLA